MKAKAVRNTHNLDFWLEGVDLQMLFADFTLAALSGRLAENAPDLLGCLGALRDHTRRLFSETYTPQGVAAELELRYGFWENCPGRFRGTP